MSTKTPEELRRELNASRRLVRELRNALGEVMGKLADLPMCSDEFIDEELAKKVRKLRGY